MEPTGFAAGIISVTGLALNCAEAYRFCCTATNLGQDGADIFTKYVVQQTRFYFWMIDTGFHTAAEDTDLDEDLRTHDNFNILGNIRRTLTTILLTLNSCKSLLEKYDVKPTLEEPEPREAEGISQLVQVTNALILPASYWKLHNKMTYADLQTQMKDEYSRISKSVSLWRKFKWALVDKEAFSAKVNDLREHNDNLIMLCQRTGVVWNYQLPSKLLPKIREPGPLNLLQAAVKDTEPILAACARIKLLAQQNLGSWDKVKINASEWKPSAGRVLDSNRSLGTYGGQDVLLEFKATRERISDEEKRCLEEKLGTLALVFNQDIFDCTVFNALSVVRFFYDARPSQNGFGILYNVPPSFSPGSGLQSLFECIKGMSPPALGIRFKMAQSIATTLLYVHSAQWYHKDINPHNILVFANASGYFSGLNLAKPFLVGFGESRSTVGASEKRITRGSLDIYRHPDYKGYPAEEIEERGHFHDPTFTGAYDLYSLGVVLFEIACWKTADTLINVGTELSHARFREKLLETAVTFGPRVGDFYKGSMVFCIGLDASAGADKDKVHEMLLWNVHHELMKCSA